METETASHRSAETRHSRPVRWFIDQIEAVKERVEEVRAGGTSDREQLWPEEAYHRGRPVAVRKKLATRVEQSELWPVDPKREECMASERVMVGDEPVLEEVVCVRVEPETVKQAVPMQKERRKIYPGLQQPVRREKSRAVRRSTIAKFLNLTGAIEVPKPNEIYFDFPGHGHFQSLHLWRGSPEPQDFSPDQF